MFCGCAMWRAMWRAMGVLWACYGRAMWSLLEATAAAAAATTASAAVTAAVHDVDHRDAWHESSKWSCKSQCSTCLDRTAPSGDLALHWVRRCATAAEAITSHI